MDILSKIESLVKKHNRDDIFVIGKGPSVDRVNHRVFEGALTIGVNDAERIYPTDITIFHADWVKRAVAPSGGRAKLYLTSTDFSSEQADVFRLEHMRLSQDGVDLMLQRLLGGAIVIEDVLFMTALNIAIKVSKMKNRKQNVYMVGFDFDPAQGYAYVDGGHYEDASAADRVAIIGLQEHYFKNAIYSLGESGIEIFHVGERPYSDLSPAELSCGLTDKRLPSSSQVSVVAELTTNHFGDRQRLERMVRLACSAGADYIKVQKRDVDTFYSEEQLKAPYRSPFGKTFEDYRRQLELDGDDLAFLDDLCRGLGVNWFASVLDEKSYRFVMEFSPKIIKLPSTISEHVDYIESVASSAKHEVVLSTGMTDKAYEEWILQIFQNIPKLYMMQANSAYPTPACDCNIAVVRHYHNLSRGDPRIVPAYSSHDEGWFGSTLAVAAGARMVEKHVKLGATDWAHFDAVALDLGTLQFKEYVDKIREAELILGSEMKNISPSEHHKYWRHESGEK